MIAIVGAIIGLFGAAIPEVLKFLNNKADHKHEQAMMDKQVEFAKIEHEHKIEEIQIQADAAADIEETRVLHKRGEVKKTGVKAIDAILAVLNGIVRPVVTFGFSGLYGWVKWAEYQLARQTMTAYGATQSIWNDADMGIFSAVITYWFGQRGMRYVFGKLRPAE